VGLVAPLSVMALLAISILSGLLLWPGLGDGYIGYNSGRTIYSNPPLGVRVLTQGSGGELIIVIKDHGGRPLRAVYSLYAWMPNGSIVDLGVYGGVGVIRANYSAARAIAEEWEGYLRARGNDPSMVMPSILLMGSIHGDEGVYDSIRGAPIRITDVKGNKSIVIEIIEDLRAKEPLVKINRSQSTTTPQSTGHITPADSVEMQSSWPPGVIVSDACYGFFGGYVCYTWRLEEVYASALGVPIPLIAVQVRGPEADKLRDIYMRAIYRSSSSVSVSIDFTISAEVKGSSGTLDYRIVGPSISLTGDNTWLDVAYTLLRGVHFTPPAIVATTFIGDLAFSRYRLWREYCVWGACTQYPLSDTSNMTLMRPAIVDNKMVPRLVIDSNPYDGQGFLEYAFNFYMQNWRWSSNIKRQDYVSIDHLKVISDIVTLPELSISSAVLGILCLLRGGPVCGAALTSPVIIGASVGATSSRELYMYVGAVMLLDGNYAYKGYWIWANYFYSPSDLLYKGSRYYIGSLYIDAFVYRA